MDPEGLIYRGADALTPSNRIFYEDTKVKLVLSIIFAGFSLMFLGFVATDGGQSVAAKYE